MPRLLHLDSSADLARSRSRAITAAFADGWRQRGADHVITYRDLHRDPPRHLADAALHWPARLRPADAEPPSADEEFQQVLLAELLSADAVVIGAPLYNYSVPSTLKAWIDHIHVPGVTAPFDVASQPMAGRRAVIVTSRGGAYDAGSAAAGTDHAVPALELILGKHLGMVVDVIATSRTLADVVPAMAREREAALAEFEAAMQQAAQLAASV